MFQAFFAIPLTARLELRIHTEFRSKSFTLVQVLSAAKRRLNNNIPDLSQ